VIIVAGGQGTRLGFDAPKGVFPIGPVSGASLFQILLEKIRAARDRYQAAIPLYVMTSPATHADTAAYLTKHEQFGLPEEDVQLFCQGTMPAVDPATGKLLLADKGRLFLSPDGHGGMLSGFYRSGALADCEQRGVRHLFYLQVDNPLVAVCDCEFLGYHLLAESEMTTQVVAKEDPLERVGNFVVVDGRARIIEYSDLPDAAAQQRASDGSLKLWAGSIGVHLMDVAFLKRIAQSEGGLPFHRAKKKVPYIDDSGRAIDPSQPNAIKFERFIFDLLPEARNPIAVEVDPAQAFAPLKNAPGEKKDTLEHVQAQMVRLHTDWLRAAGATVEQGVAVEISPLFAVDPIGVREKIRPGTQVSEPTYFH
jgi:UDP-N-acetylglucosamine/UDP-N-acetylgalactosamine diphosphorylase